MKPPDTPVDEVYRLDALRSLAILDTPPEQDFDAVSRLGSELLNVPICLVTLVDNDRQWFKACVGLELRETSRAVSFCGHAILREEPLIVLDATKDERFFDNPLVAGPPHIRFYAGMPLRLPSGYQIGTVCAIDSRPRAQFGEVEVRRLALLSGIAVTVIGLRGMRAELDAATRAADRLRIAVHSSASPIALVRVNGTVELANNAFDALCRENPLDGGRIPDLLDIPESEWSRAAAADDSQTALAAGGLSLRVVSEPGGLILCEAPGSPGARSSRPS